MAELGRLGRKLIDDFGLRPVIAAELEFYLHGGEPAESFWQSLQAALPIAKWERERGYGQFEIALTPLAAEQTVANLTALKILIHETAAAAGLQADFSAKPAADQPGSGLHIHLHLQNAEGKNVFFKDDTTISPELKHCLGGLVAWLPDSMAVFAPHENSYARLIAGSNAPTTASWGANNRTVAIRLPDKPHDNKHIEHRAAGADAEPEAVVEVILAAAHDGLTRELDPGPQIYGDASHAQYALPKLPGTLKEAQEKMQASESIRRYFNARLLPAI